MGLKAISDNDRETVAGLLRVHWGSVQIVSRGHVIDASKLPGFMFVGESGEPEGLITLHVVGDECEIVSLDALVSGRGIGRALMQAAIEFANAKSCRRLWLITSNDNTNALGFYQKLGLRMVAIHLDAITEARKLKPQIPMVAENGIAIRDEIELEIVL